MPNPITAQSAPITEYYTRLNRIIARGGTTEQHTRPAFQFLLDTLASAYDWTLMAEFRLKNGRVPDGTLIDDYKIPRGYWEAKDTGDDLETEIDKKVKVGYPLRNTLFEDTRRAVLYQNNKRIYEADLGKPEEVATLVSFFFTHTDPQIDEFHKAIAQFSTDVKDLADSILLIVREEQKDSPAFREAYETFYALCQTSLNQNISRQAVDEMLVQHLLTERLARTVLENPQFTRRNVIAAELEKVMDALFSRHYSRETLLFRLNYFYDTIEQVGRGIDDFSEKQKFINTLYERFFQGFSSKTADTHGIVYTPQEIVDWMCESVEQILNRDFSLSIADKEVVILDPATGTGNFVVNLLRRIHRLKPSALRDKYRSGLFANEVMLLPYYVASLNIEHTFFELAGAYENFEGICFADTLDMYAGKQMALDFVEENTERVNAEKAAPITVIIGNPPYNVGQINENDNNKNRKYPTVDQSIRDTYGKDSKATNRNALADVYVKFFRWATDRLGDRDGVIAYVTNNSFLEQIAFDGMRHHLLRNFDAVYHLDLHGNVRKNPKLSGTTHNVFGIQVGVGITLLVRKKGIEKGIFFHRVPTDWTKIEKLTFLTDTKNLDGVTWETLAPDAKNNWITEGMQADYETFLPMGTKESKADSSLDAKAIFRMYGGGLKTNRDEWAYNFDRATLERNIRNTIDFYNSEAKRWSKDKAHTRLKGGELQKYLDDFVQNDDTHIKWSATLKANLQRPKIGTFSPQHIRTASYRPFTKQSVYFDGLMNERMYQLPAFFPSKPNAENVVMWLKTSGEVPGWVLSVNSIPDIMPSGGSQCFPLYTYAANGAIRKDNLTDWALTQFRTFYADPAIEKPDIFHYVYAVLHHPEYRTRYAENLKRELPRIPLVTLTPFPSLASERGVSNIPAPDSSAMEPPGTSVTPLSLAREGKGVRVKNAEGGSVTEAQEKPESNADLFWTLARAGEALTALHVGYETAPEYPLKEEMTDSEHRPFTWRVEKMKATADRGGIVVNKTLTLTGIPEKAWAYRLGNRSALDWIMDQYQVTTDKRSGIVSDPNRDDEPEYIVRLIKRIVTVSVNTQTVLDSLPSLGLAPPPGPQ